MIGEVPEMMVFALWASDIECRVLRAGHMGEVAVARRTTPADIELSPVRVDRFVGGDVREEASGISGTDWKLYGTLRQGPAVAASRSAAREADGPSCGVRELTSWCSPFFI
jgi:hypothetical protein